MRTKAPCFATNYVGAVRVELARTVKVQCCKSMTSCMKGPSMSHHGTSAVLESEQLTLAR